MTTRFYIYTLMRIQEKNMNYVRAKTGTYLHAQYLIPAGYFR